jgi:hypothetical protein
MTVAVVYAVSPTSRLALLEAVEEARRRGETWRCCSSPDPQT